MTEKDGAHGSKVEGTWETENWIVRQSGLNLGFEPKEGASMEALRESNQIGLEFFYHCLVLTDQFDLQGLENVPQQVKERMDKFFQGEWKRAVG